MKFSYPNINNLARDFKKAFASDTPTLVRLDVAYGKGTASQWLYRLLQPMFMFLGVTKEKFSKEMVYDLACTIAHNPMYSKMTVAEIMFFIALFKGGTYGRFYGDTSYVLTVTEGLRKFWEERDTYYSMVERELEERKMREEKNTPHMSFAEWKKMKEERGEEVHMTDNGILIKGKETNY